MEKLSVTIVLVGIPSSKIEFKYLSKWKSKLFKIDPIPLILSNLSELDYDGINLTDEMMRDLFTARVHSDCDLIMGITDRNLEGNWFTRRISSNSIIISYFEFEDVLMKNAIPLENFILRFIYPLSLIYLNYNRSVPETENTLIHKDSQRCIFDFMKYKIDVLETLIKPKICEYSKSKFKIALPNNFLQNIEKELQGLNRKLFYRLKLWITKKPILSILITGLLALILNLLSSIIYQLIFNK